MLAVQPVALTVRRKRLGLVGLNAETEFIEAAIQQLRPTQNLHPTEFIMSKPTTLIQTTVAALLLAFGVGHKAQAAPQDIVTLPRVVIVGKATPDVQIAKIEQLPRVVVVGRSAGTQQPQQLLASNAAAAPLAVKFIARAL